jgi:hypothetical protein
MQNDQYIEPTQKKKKKKTKEIMIFGISLMP